MVTRKKIKTVKRQSNVTRRRKIKDVPATATATATTDKIASAIKTIPFERAAFDFKALQAVDFTRKKTSVLHSAKIGNVVMDYYFLKHRLNTKTKRGVSYYEWIKTRWQHNASEYRMYKFNLAQGKSPEQARYGVFRLYYGAVQGFKPLIAKWLYTMYTPKVAILDFSAGWGGRCLAAMTLGIPYIGIDTNVDLRPVYQRMVRELTPLLPDTMRARADVRMNFKDAATVDYSDYDYDMVFTSPPYFKTLRPAEVYAHMPNYESREDFNERFLFPAVRNTYAHLKRGGTYAINVPEDAFQDIRQASILPSRLSSKHRLFIQPRFAKGNPVNPDKQYKEYIYIWKKP
jgi:tRNA1(Val) A37 N6-methylase TrmN6